MRREKEGDGEEKMKVLMLSAWADVVKEAHQLGRVAQLCPGQQQAKKVKIAIPTSGRCGLDGSATDRQATPQLAELGFAIGFGQQSLRAVVSS
tara:strand:+ start:210 stop:488 length:279 start_codon:yes stop_codon:yes gene_type:complete